MTSINIDSKQFASLKGRVALVTGGSSGIGLCLVQSLLSLDCRVIIGDLAPPSPLPTSDTSRLLFHRTNVASYPSLLSLFHTAKSHFSSYPDIVFANAGIAEKGQVFGGEDEIDTDIETEPKHEVLEIDLKAVANTVRIAWWACKKEGKEGTIILTASMAGYMGQPGLDMYNAAKHGVVGLMRALRYSAPRSKLSISLIAPGITVTPLIASPSLDLSSTASALSSSGVPLNTAQQIADAGLYLVSLGKKANGVGLAVQGGMIVDFEKGLAKGRESWMGAEMARMYKGGKREEGNADKDNFFVGLKKRGEEKL